MPSKMEWATVYQSSAFVMCHLFAQHLAALGSTAYLETEEDVRGDERRSDLAQPERCPEGGERYRGASREALLPDAREPMVNSLTLECCLVGFCDESVRKNIVVIDSPQYPMRVSEAMSVETLEPNYKVQQEIDDYLHTNQGPELDGHDLSTKSMPVAMSVTVDCEEPSARDARSGAPEGSQRQQHVYAREES